MKSTQVNNTFDNMSLQQTISKLIFVVDDEPDILELVSINLKKSGFRVKGFNESAPMLNSMNSEAPDLIVLDLMLPDADGFEICKILRSDKKYSSIPIIMLTARVDEMDKVLGLELGADDYLTKPFSPRELIARIKAVLRREANHTNNSRLKAGDLLEIDINRHEVYVGNVRVELTTTEFRILYLLSERKGWVYSREQILDHLGLNEKGVLDRTVDVHIKNLREKLGPAGKYIRNVRSIGYKIEA